MLDRPFFLPHPVHSGYLPIHLCKRTDGKAEKNNYCKIIYFERCTQQVPIQSGKRTDSKAK